MATVETSGGTTVYYEEHGSGEPLLCVMGLATDTLGWALQVPTFSERHRTVTFDNRDVGQSSAASGPYEVADMAQNALDRRNRRLATLRSEVRHDDGRLIATAIGSYTIFPLKKAAVG